MKTRSTGIEKNLKGLRNRSPQAVECWFGEHADAVYTFVFYRVGKDRELANDVVQETFLKALHKIREYDPRRGPMLAWLTYVSRNCIRRTLVAQGRHREYAEVWENIDERLAAAYRELAAAPLPDEVLIRQETTELVHEALSNLPVKYQRALKLRYYDQQPVEEIARAEGLTTGAAKALLHRARLAFKAAFETIAAALHDPGILREPVP